MPAAAKPVEPAPPPEPAQTDAPQTLEEEHPLEGILKQALSQHPKQEAAKEDVSKVEIVRRIFQGTIVKR
jgi:hypothetical protein